MLTQDINDVVFNFFDRRQCIAPLNTAILVFPSSPLSLFLSSQFALNPFYQVFGAVFYQVFAEALGHINCKPEKAAQRQWPTSRNSCCSHRTHPGGYVYWGPGYFRIKCHAANAFTLTLLG